MTNPTSNFGWQMPTPVDLVTDLPADFEVFGQAVDTSLADLKGGTTGQVLKKNTNTDMDFVWSSDNGILPSNFTAKGDLLVGTGSGTFSAQTVGANGTILTADSAEADGVKWALPASDTWALVSSTNLPTGAAALTISSIPLRKSLMIFCGSVQTPASSVITLRINGDTAANYTAFGTTNESVATYASAALNQGQFGGATNFTLLRNNNGSGNEGVISVRLDATNSTGFKTFQSVSAGGSSGGGSAQRQHQLLGFYAGTSVVSSITITSSTGNFASAQAVTIYGTV